MEHKLETTQNDIIEKGSSNSIELKIGTVLDGKCEIKREIARGGIGIVYEAYYNFFKKKVAVKIIHSIKIDSLQFQRFRKEIEAYEKLSHPNIIHIYDAWIYKNTPYIIMEYIDGVDICQYVTQHDKNYGKQKLYNTELGTKKDWKLCARLIYEVALGLEYIHKQKMLHRDIKPSNIMVRSDGTPIIIDLGLVKFKEKKFSSLTKSGEIIGTFQYMPIEQAKGKQGRVDERSDVYSLGLVLYELLTEKIAYSGKNVLEICYKIMSYYPPLPREINPQIPEVLEEITMRAIDKKKEKRYASAQEFADALKKYLDDENGQETKKYNDYKKQVQVNKNKKHIIACFIALVIGIIATISMITSNSNITPTENPAIIPSEQTEPEKKVQKDYEVLKKKYDNLTQDIAKDRNELSNYSKECYSLEEQQNKLGRDIAKDNNKLSNYDKECDIYKEQQVNFIQDLEKSQLEVKSLSQQIDSKQKELQSLEDGSNPWSLAESNRVWKKYEKDFQKTEKEINNIESELEDAENEKIELENELSSMWSERKNLNDDIESIKNKMEPITTRIKEFDKEIKDLEESINMIPTRPSEDENEDDESYRRELEYLQLERKRKLEPTIQRLRELQNEENEKENNLRTQERNKENELKVVNAKINEIHSNIDKTNERIRSSEKKLSKHKDLYKRLEVRKNGAQEFEQRQEKIKQELEQLSTQYNEKKEKERSLNEDLNRVKISLSISEKEYNSLLKKIIDKENQAQKLQNELSIYEKKYKSLLKKIIDKENQAQKLQNELNKLQPLLNKILLPVNSKEKQICFFYNAHCIKKPR